MRNKKKSAGKRNEETNPQLADLLIVSFTDIANVWAKKLEKLGEGTPLLSRKKAQTIAENYLNAIIRANGETSKKKLQGFLRKIFLSPEKPKLNLPQTQKTLAKGKESIHPVLEDKYRDNPSYLLETTKRIDSCFDEIAYQLAKIEITEKKKLEGKLKQTRSYFEDLIESSSDSFIATDMKGKIIYFSKGAEKIFGYKAEEVLGNPMSEYYLKGRDAAKKAMKILWEKQKFSTFEARMVAKDKRIFSMNISLSFYNDEKGNPVGTLGICRDFTEIKKLERQIQQSEKLAAMGQLAAGFAHEIGTPLNVISGTAEYLMADMDKSGPRFADLDTIVSQTRQIIKLVQRFLDSSRYRKPELIPAIPVDLNALIKKALRLIDRQVIESNISVETNFCSDVLPVMGDPDQFQQVFLNLIINACHAMKSGGVLNISTRMLPVGSLSYVDSNVVEITISDTGCGIPENYLQKIFNPFFTTKDIGKGTGLGLTVSHRIVENHRGIIEVESEIDKGATFIVKFPAAEKGKKSGEYPDLDN